MRQLAVLYCLVFCFANGLAQNADNASTEDYSSSENICDSIAHFYSEKNYHSAFALLLQFPDQCVDTDSRLINAQVLAASNEYTLALFELKKIKEDSKSKEVSLVQNRISELRGLDSTQYSGTVFLDSASTTFNDIPFISQMSNQRVLHDESYVQSHFPQKVMVEGRYQLSKPGPNQPKWEQEVYHKNFHDIGPSEIWKDSVLFVSALDLKAFRKTEKQQFTILALNAKEEKWLKEYSIEPIGKKMHPTIKGDTLVFSSDMEGGYGGMDLWQVQITSSGFQNLENLGPTVNSEGNEVFPKWNDGKLYFASDNTKRGYGGLDIYEFTADTIALLAYPVNTSYDDFGFSRVSEDTIHLFSNRPGGKGGDDVYFVVSERKQDFFPELSGRIEAEGVDLTGVQVMVSREDGTFMGYATMDKAGYFKIKHVKGNENYQLEVMDKELPEGSGLKLYNEGGDMLKEVTVNLSGTFVFELLTPVDYFLMRKENEDESVLSVDIFGQVEAEDELEEGLKIYLEDSHGELIGISTTNALGAFEFEGMKPDAQYTIRSEVKDPNSIIRILDDDGTVLQTIHPGEEINFVFIRLGEGDKVITLTNEMNQEVTVSQNEQFNLPVIHYELDQAKLSKDGEQALDRVVLLLKKNPEVSVDISGHTDARGPAGYNLKLSQERMDEVIRYLDNADIDKSRLHGKGYGESKLKNKCKDGVDCTEYEHAENRRTEIRVYKK